MMITMLVKQGHSKYASVQRRKLHLQGATSCHMDFEWMDRSRHTFIFNSIRNT